MTDRESLNQHNVSPGISLLVNHNAVSRSVDINCSEARAFNVTSALLQRQHKHATDMIKYFFKEGRQLNYISIFLNLDRREKYKCSGIYWK